MVPQSLDLLTRYNWPGNVRELENEMERALAMVAGRKNIPPEFLSDKISPPDLNYSIGEGQELSASLKNAVCQLETRMIREALRKAQGNRSQAARALGLSRQGLLNKITAYHVQE